MVAGFGRRMGAVGHALEAGLGNCPAETAIAGSIPAGAPMEQKYVTITSVMVFIDGKWIGPFRLLFGERLRLAIFWGSVRVARIHG